MAFLYLALSLSLQSKLAVSANNIFSNLLWVSSETCWGLLLDKNHTHVFLGDKSFSSLGFCWDTRETTPFNFPKAYWKDLQATPLN